MEQTTTPTRAYDLLDFNERQAVDDYVKFAISYQRSLNQRIALALDTPIPSEYVRRSKGALAKPLVRAAVAERLQAEANEQDLSPDRIIKEHANIAFSNIADYLTVGQFGDFSVKPLDTIPRQALSAVKSMKTIPGPWGLRTEINLHDKQMSLKVLTELVGLVAPDKPPVLEEYAKPPRERALTEQVPEKAYLEYLCKT